MGVRRMHAGGKKGDLGQRFGLGERVFRPQVEGFAEIGQDRRVLRQRIAVVEAQHRYAALRIDFQIGVGALLAAGEVDFLRLVFFAALLEHDVRRHRAGARRVIKHQHCETLLLYIAVEQFDRHAFRRADEADAHPGPHRGRLAGEFDTLGLEVGGDGVDAAHRKPEMIETAIRRRRRRVDAVAGFDRRDEDIGAAEFHVDARLALLHGADHLGAELLLEPLRHRLGIGGAQVDVIPRVIRHGAYSPCLLALCANSAERYDMFERDVIGLFAGCQSSQRPSSDQSNREKRDMPAVETVINGAYADLPGVKLWFTDTGGAGVPLVLLHPNTGTVEIWQPQIAAFAAAGYRVIAFDRKGWGKSLADPASGPQPGSIAGDLDALADHLKLKKFHLLGVAGGGFIALDYAAWRPQKLRSLIVGGSTGSFEDKAIADFIARIAIPEIRKQSAHYREIGASYRGANPEGTRRWIEIDEHARQPGAGFQPQLRTPNTLAKIAAITPPTLVIAADADLLAPPALMRIWAAHLRYHEWAVIHDAGHAMAWEQPGAFNDTVLDFLRRH